MFQADCLRRPSSLLADALEAGPALVRDVEGAGGRKALEHVHRPVNELFGGFTPERMPGDRLRRPLAGLAHVEHEGAVRLHVH